MDGIFLKERKMKIGNFTKLLKLILFHYSFLNIYDAHLTSSVSYAKECDAYTGSLCLTFTHSVNA